MGFDLELVHEAFHDCKAHAAALLSAGGVHGLHRLFKILYAPAPIAHGYLEFLAFEYAQTHGYLADAVGVCVDDAVCDRFRYGGLDIAELLQRRVKLRSKARCRRSCEALVCAVARKFKLYVVCYSH